MIRIVPYAKNYQGEIDSMLFEIAIEFKFSIFASDTSKKSKQLDNYWVALDANKIVGTIGMIKIEKPSVVLKRMFVRKSHLGSTIGLSASLFQKALDWCTIEQVKYIYLGTMQQFNAAHWIYEKNGFQKIVKNDLPKNFNVYSLHDVCYKKMI